MEEKKMKQVKTIGQKIKAWRKKKEILQKGSVSL